MWERKNIIKKDAFKVLSKDALLNIEGGEYKGIDLFQNLKNYLSDLFNLNDSVKN